MAINVYRTHIEITNYKLGDKKSLERRFMIYDKRLHYSYPKSMFYDKKSMTLYIPRGVSISYLERVFGMEANISSVMDRVDYIKDSSIMLKKKPRDDFQNHALRFLLCKGEYQNNRNYTMLSLNLNTGRGKSYCCIAALSYYNVKGIIITSQTDWLNQWKEYFLEYTDINPKEIYNISGTPSIMKLYNKDVSKYKVFLCTHRSIKNYATKNGWNAVTDLFNFLGIGIKIYDESHLEFDNMFMIDCFTNTMINYYVTATPSKSDDDENAIYNRYFENIPSIDLFDPNVDPHTHYIGIKYNSNPTPIQLSECKNAYGMDRNKYVDYLIHQENFYRMLRIIIDKAIRKGGKYLMYVATNEAIMVVKQWIYDNYPELIGSVGVYSMLTPKEKKREQLDKFIILTTTKSAGQAVDIKGLTDTIVLAEPFKSRVLARQTLGRTRDENTNYKDLVDIGFFFTKRFYDQKKPIFMKYASDCKEVIINNTELKKLSDAIEERHNKLINPVERWEEYKPPLELINPVEFIDE